MKLKTVFLGALLLAACCSPCQGASGAVTLECRRGTNYSATLVLSETETATVKSYLDSTMNEDNPQLYDGALVTIATTTGSGYVDAKLGLQNYGFFGSSRDPVSFKIAGPATIQLRPSPWVRQDFWALLTVEVEPGFCAPDKAATIGPNAGTVGVAMETSTNLIQWSTATNGLVYTNSPSARFFRIKMDKLAESQP